MLTCQKKKKKKKKNRNRLQYAQATIVKNLVGYLGDSNVPVCISAMKVSKEKRRKGKQLEKKKEKKRKKRNEMQTMVS